MKISKREVLYFVRTALNIKDFADKFKRNKLDALNEIIKAFHHEISFNNIYFMCKEFRERRTPTVKESLEMVFSKQGGLCLTLNIVIYLILKALDYKVYLVIGTVRNKNDHVICISKELDDNPESRYVIEVGCGSPTFEAIKLVRNGESQENGSKALRFKYRDMGNDQFHRLNGKKNKQTGEMEWEVFYRFDVESEISILEAEQCIGNIVYMNPENRFNIYPFMVTFLNERMILLRCDKLSIEMEDGKVEYTEYDNDELLCEQLMKYFPGVIKSELIKAFLFWRQAGSPSL